MTTEAGVNSPPASARGFSKRPGNHIEGKTERAFKLSFLPVTNFPNAGEQINNCPDFSCDTIPQRRRSPS
jgi:hypothetical protein